MISKEDEQKVLEFAKNYKERADKVSGYKDELTILQKDIQEELKTMEELRNKELKFLDDLRLKYDTTPDVVVQLIQKIILANG
jgi:hypothetical protein|tara:strand:+ start:9652 stop:9900 length:249 start_codon:yes stop_codon:yes gene_type:complete